MKLPKIVIWLGWLGIIFLSKDIWLGMIHHLPEFAKFGWKEWLMILYIIANVWLWKNHKLHPALTILWKNLLYAYTVFVIALGITYVRNKFRDKK